MIVKPGETRKLEIKNATFDAFTFKAILFNAAVNTAVLRTDLNTDLVNVKAVLKRSGREFTLFQDTLTVLAMESNFFTSLFDYLSPASATSVRVILLAAATGVTEKVMIPMSVDLGSSINLSGDDQLDLEINFASAAVAANCSIATSYIEFDYRESVGVEHVTPYIKSKSIAPGEQRLQQSLGDNITSVVLLNTDKTGVLDASAILASISLSSDKLNMNDNYVEILNKRFEQFKDVTIAGNRCQSFLLHKGAELDGCQVDATLIPGNITAGKNFLVTRSYYTDARLLAKADAVVEKHQIKDAIKHGVIDHATASKHLSDAHARIAHFTPRKR